MSTMSRYSGLDGLRGIAILLVLLYHLTPGKNSDQGIKSLLFKIADIGWVGVDLFFVLSGFLITSILLRYKRQGKPYRNYFVRRLLRIMPLYYFSLILLFIVVPFISQNKYLLLPFEVQLPFWLYASNYFSEYTVHTRVYSLDHFWSLAVEMQFYLIWPIIIKVLDHAAVIKYGVLFLATILLSRMLAVGMDVYWQITYEWLPFRLDSLMIGSLIAVYLDWRARLPIKGIHRAIGMILLGAVVFYVAWTHQGGAIFKSPDTLSMFLVRCVFPIIVSLFFGFLLIASLDNGFIKRSLSNSVLAIIAKYSYGLYVIHFILEPVFKIYIYPWVIDRFGRYDAGVYVYFAATSIISFLLAMLSYHMLEVKFLRMKDRIAP